MNEPINDLIAEMQIHLTVHLSGKTAILTYREKNMLSLSDLEAIDISCTYPLSQNLYNLFTRSASEEHTGEDETATFIQRLIDWCYIPTSLPQQNVRAYGEHSQFTYQEIFALLIYFRRMRKLAKELRAFIGKTDFERIAFADYCA